MSGHEVKQGQTKPQPHPGAGHRARLRDKFLHHGLAKFTDEEALEPLLNLTTPRQDCNQQASALLKALGGLRGVLEADPRQLAAVPGVGPKNILGFKLVQAVAKRFLEDHLLSGAVLNSPQEAADYFPIHHGRAQVGGLSRAPDEPRAPGRRRLGDRHRHTGPGRGLSPRGGGPRPSPRSGGPGLRPQPPQRPPPAQPLGP